MFATIINFILDREGGYVNDPADPGGATNYGITQKTLDAYNFIKGIPKYDVKNLKLVDAINIYYSEYWNQDWEKLGFPLAACMMDTSVNMGESRAKVFLDGCGGDYVKYLQLRLAKYADLIQKNPDLAKFKNGWNNRMAELRRFIDGEKDSIGSNSLPSSGVGLV